MSRDPGEGVPRRRPRPESKRQTGAGGKQGGAGVPNREPQRDPEEPTTWRPNPKRAGASPSPSQAPARPAAQRIEPLEPVPAGPSWWERIVFGRASSGQLALYCRQFAAYLDAGVDLLKTLTSLERQFTRTALGPVTGRLLLAVRRGDALAEAMEREPGAFDPLFLSMMKVAEARGGVPETLRMLSRHYEARQSLIRQARTAMIYPIAVLVVASGVVALFTVWLLPMFVSMLRETAGPGTTLPLPSRMLMAFSSFIGALGWWLVPLLMIAGPLAVVAIYRTALGKQVMDELSLWVPVLGLLLKKLDTTRFARSLGSLLGAGVDIGTSLDLTAGVVRLDPLRRAIRRARSAVVEGGELSVALGVTGRFGADVIAVIESGEETGKLPERLDHLADDYQEQVAYMVKNMGQLIQPLMVVVLGAVVLFIILAVFLPYIAIITNLTK
jgi:type II secretory pathway component PulF